MSNSRIAACRVPAEASGRKLLDYLTARFSYFSAAQWSRMIAAGHLKINDATGQPDSLLTAGDHIVCNDLPNEEPPVDPDIRVVYEDHALLVVSKPGNLPCHPAGRYFRHTLWHWLKFEAQLQSPHFVNRLDRETSGLVAIAKTADTAAACQRQFRAGLVSKQYLVLVEGRFDPVLLKTEGYLIPAPGRRVRKKRHFSIHSPSPHPPAACRTTFKRLAQGPDMALLLALPRTGQTHQIRATLCSLGFPVVGDKIYGCDEALFLRFIEDRLSDQDWQRLRLRRQALHARALYFRHPHRRIPLRLEASLPQDMAVLIDAVFGDIPPEALRSK